MTIYNKDPVVRTLQNALYLTEPGNAVLSEDFETVREITFLLLDAQSGSRPKKPHLRIAAIENGFQSLGCKRIRSKDFSGFVTPFSRFPNLKRLCFQRDSFDGFPFKLLSGVKSLESFSLAAGQGKAQDFSLSLLSENAGLQDLSLTLPGKTLDCRDLLPLKNLQTLTLSVSALSHPEALGELEGLRTLTLWQALEDCQFLSRLTGLRYLNLKHFESGDLKPLSGLRELEYLALKAGKIQDLSPLSGLSNLRMLGLIGHQISDIQPLVTLPLKALSLDQNLVEDVTPLSKIPSLTFLELRNNLIHDLSPLAGMKKLQVLHIEGNFIFDFSPLLECGSLMEIRGNIPAGQEGPLNAAYPFTQCRS